MSRLVITSFEFKDKPIKIACVLDESNRPILFDVLNDIPTLIGNIYVGRVQSIAKQINAAFIEYEPGKKAFYSLGESAPVFVKQNHPEKGLSIGDELLIEITKDSFGDKDPVATSNLSFKNEYILISSGKLSKGISQKIKNIDKRNELKNWLENKPDDIGIIARTNSIDIKIDELDKKFEDLYNSYNELLLKAKHLKTYSIIRKSGSDVKYLLDNINLKDLDGIITDDSEVYKEICALDISTPLTLYDNNLPIYKVYSLHTRLEEALGKKVYLKSGGYLFIEPTEALTVIDVNSGKKNTNKSKEENALEINIEAAEEIVTQLSLRNISGIVIIDFINMNEESSKNQLLSKFQEFAKKDCIGIQVLGLTALGLCEITRKKTKKPLFSQIYD